jgi:hypothetical protein
LQSSFERELDARFDEAFTGPGTTTEERSVTLEPGLTIEDRDELKRTFDQIAALHLRPVRDFMVEVRHGRAPTTWTVPCRAAIIQLRKAASQLEREDLSAGLDLLDEALETAGKASEPLVGEGDREALLSAYETLVPVAPEALTLDGERERREPIIVRSLLLQTEDVEFVTVGKLFGAGLNDLSTLLVASADEMAVTANIPLDLAKRIVETLSAYRTSFGVTTGSADLASERQHLVALLDRLRDVDLAFEKASTKWSPEALAAKQRLRATRATVLLQVDVMLARIGETEQVDSLKRLPVRGRIERLGSFLSGFVA